MKNIPTLYALSYPMDLIHLLDEAVVLVFSFHEFLNEKRIQNISKEAIKIEI